MSFPALPSRITAVTVFRKGAVVTREVSLEATDGAFPDGLRVTGLPLCLDDASIKVRIAAPNNGKPVATDLRVGLEIPEPDAALAPPRNEEIVAARHRVHLIEDRLTQCTASRARMEALMPPDRPRGEDGAPPPPSPSEARIALFAFRHAQLDRLASEAAELARDLEDAREHLQVLESRRKTATTHRNVREHELRKVLIIRLASKGEGDAGRCRLILEYEVPGARWAPTYVVRFGPAFDHAELRLRAAVCQATGEDWNNARLTVSTADAQRWTDLPELPALRIGRVQPLPVRTGWREPPMGAEALFADYDEAVKVAVPARPRMAAPMVGKADVIEAALAEEADAPEAAEPMLAEPAMAGAMPPPEVVAASVGPLMAKKKRKRGKPRTEAGAVAQAPPPSPGPSQPTEAEPAELSAPADLMDFRRLRLAPASDPSRAKLRPMSDEDLYLEYLVSVEVDVQVDVSVVAAIFKAQARADVAGQTPPPGLTFPGAWDGFDHSWTAGHPVEIPSDGTYHSVPLLARRSDSSLHYVVVPAEGSEAWRFVSLENPLETPLPEGPADVYVADDFLLTSRIDTVAPRSKVELGLGVEEAVKTARKVRFTEHGAGLLGSILKLEHDITITLANRMSKPANIEIRERVPIRRKGDDDIEVEVVGVDPPWQPFHQNRRPIEGAYRWRVTVPGGEEKEMKASYIITISSKNELVGGNRRER